MTTKLIPESEAQALIAAALALFAQKAAALQCDGCRAGVTLAYREPDTHDRPGRWHVGPNYEFLCTANDILALVSDPNALAEHDAALRERIDQLECQLAGCDVAAMGWADKNPDSPAPKQGAWGWSPAFQSVLELRQKWEKLEAENAELRESLEWAVYALEHGSSVEVHWLKHVAAEPHMKARALLAKHAAEPEGRTTS